MSAEGNVEIQVRAEGADDAAEELAQGAEAQPGGRGRLGRAGLAGAISGGIVGGVLAQAVKPLLNVLDPILKVLQAFLAPVAVMLMRVLAPVLREVLKLLPGWFDFVTNAEGWFDELIAFVRNIPSAIEAFIRDPLGFIGRKFGEIVGQIWGDANITNRLANAVAQGLRRFVGGDRPAVGDLSEPSQTRTQDVTRSGIATGASTAFGPLGPAARPFIEIALQGGLDTFVERAERETGIDVPFLGG